MKLSLYQSKLSRILRHRHLFMRMALYELGIIAMLIVALFYAFLNERTIITPPVVQRSFWVERNTVSEAYLAEMTNFFINLRFNLSSANADVQRDILLRYTDARYYTAMKLVLTNEAERIKKQNLTIAFYPVEIKVNPKNLQAHVTGDLVSTLGQTVLPTQRVTYAITYRYQQGYLSISRLEEFKPNAN